MQRFRRFLYRERRRIGLFVLLVTLAAFLIYSDEIGVEFGIRHAAVTAVGTGVGAGLIALGLLMINPHWRHALETVAIATFLYAVVIVQLPGVSFHDDAHSLAAFTLYLVAAALVHLAIYGRWSDRWLYFGNHVERTIAITRLDRTTVWEAACPAAATIDSYWDDSLTTVTPVDGSDDTLLLFHLFPDGMMMEQEIRFDQVNPGKSFRYVYRRLHVAERGRQSMALVLEQRGPVLALHLRWERAGYPCRLALMHWIDDWGGRATDRQLIRLEEAARLGEAGGWQPA